MEHATLLDFSSVILPPENRADKFFLPHVRYFLRSGFVTQNLYFTVPDPSQKVPPIHSWCHTGYFFKDLLKVRK